jgi:hypothetical protein
VDYTNLVKRLSLPAGFVGPRELAHDDVRAAPITRDDLDDDVRGINSSIELIRHTRGGRWPSHPVSAEENYVDLVWHECEFRDNHSFTYVARDDRGGYLGCCYLYPMGVRTPLSETTAQHDVDVSWWVTQDAYDAGWYPKVYRALRVWTTTAFPFTNPYFSNARIPDRDSSGPQAV